MHSRPVTVCTTVTNHRQQSSTGSPGHQVTGHLTPPAIITDLAAAVYTACSLAPGQHSSACHFSVNVITSSSTPTSLTDTSSINRINHKSLSLLPAFKSAIICPGSDTITYHHRRYCQIIIPTNFPLFSTFAFHWVSVGSLRHLPLFRRQAAGVISTFFFFTDTYINSPSSPSSLPDFVQPPPFLPPSPLVDRHRQSSSLALACRRQSGA